MKFKIQISLFIILLFFATLSCKKKSIPLPVIDSKNRTLINIPLEELKSLLAGNWFLTKKRDCGVAGCFNTTYNSGEEDLVSFLPQDSVKRVKANGVILVYDKASISKSTYDNSWVYEMAGGLQIWTFQEIKNDTLLAEFNQAQGRISYLIRKP
jgi:hypothetical protein